MDKNKGIKNIFEKSIEEKILLRRKIFLEFGEIPEEILLELVDKLDTSKEYILRFIDDPEDFKYYIKKRNIIDYEEAVEDGAFGKITVKNEELKKIYGTDLTFGKYTRQGKNILENEKGKFNISSNYIIEKKIEILEGLVVEKEIDENSKIDIMEYCIYVPNILKFTNYKE